MRTISSSRLVGASLLGTRGETIADQHARWLDWVDDDGGTVVDAAAALAARTMLREANVYNALAFSGSAEWAHKGMGTADEFLYSLNFRKNDRTNSAGGGIDIDTSLSRDTVILGNTGQWMEWDVDVRTAQIAMIARDASPAATYAVSGELSWTASGQASFIQANGLIGVETGETDPTTSTEFIVRLSPNEDFPRPNAVGGGFIDYARGIAGAFHSEMAGGADTYLKGTRGSIPPHVLPGDSLTFRLQSAPKMSEFYVFDGEIDPALLEAVVADIVARPLS